MDYRIVVPSRGRFDKITTVSNLMKNVTFVVPKAEYEDYSKVVTNVVSLPEEISGISRIRQWILDNFKENTIVFCDDDLVSMKCLVGISTRVYKDADTIMKVVENSIRISNELDIDLFYFSRNPNPMYFLGSSPISFCGGFAGGIFGVNKRRLKFDKHLTTREDVDLTLQALLTSILVQYGVEQVEIKG